MPLLALARTSINGANSGREPPGLARTPLLRPLTHGLPADEPGRARSFYNARSRSLYVCVCLLGLYPPSMEDYTFSPNTIKILLMYT